MRLTVHEAPRRHQMDTMNSDLAYEFYMDEEINEQIQTMLREEE